jgi:hypothetical protein
MATGMLGRRARRERAVGTVVLAVFALASAAPGAFPVRHARRDFARLPGRTLFAGAVFTIHYRLKETV